MPAYDPPAAALVPALPEPRRAAAFLEAMPKRIQMRRTPGWRKPPDVVYVGRPTVWGNPWRVGGRAHGALGPVEAVAEYERALTAGELKDPHGGALIGRVGELRGKDLACWCDLDKPCHADVLLRYANVAS